MYDVKSLKAEEFINDEEIKATLEYAEQNKHNKSLSCHSLKKHVLRRQAEVLNVQDLLTGRQVCFWPVTFLR